MSDVLKVIKKKKKWEAWYLPHPLRFVPFFKSEAQVRHSKVRIGAKLYILGHTGTYLVRKFPVR